MALARRDAFLQPIRSMRPLLRGPPAAVLYAYQTRPSSKSLLSDPLRPLFNIVPEGVERLGVRFLLLSRVIPADALASHQRSQDSHIPTLFRQDRAPPAQKLVLQVVFLAGNLSRHLPQWRNLTTNAWILGIIESGFCLPWSGLHPPLTRLVPPCSPPSSVEIGRVLAHEVVALLQKEAIERVHDSLSPGFYGRLFVVPKTTGGWRPVLDLSPFNVFLKKCPFRMGLQSLYGTQ